MCYKLSTVPGWPVSCLSKRRLEFQNEGTRVSSSKRQQAAVGAPAPHKSLLAAVCSAAREMEQTIESRAEQSSHQHHCARRHLIPVRQTDSMDDRKGWGQEREKELGDRASVHGKVRECGSSSKSRPPPPSQPQQQHAILVIIFLSTGTQ